MSSSQGPSASNKHTTTGVRASASPVRSLPGIVGDVDVLSVDDPGVRRGGKSHSGQQEKYQSVHLVG